MFLPIGPLISFGPVVIATLAPNSTSYLASWAGGYAASFHPVLGSIYPLDLAGLGAVPLTDPTVTYLLQLFALDSDATPYATVEAQYNAIMAAIQGSYSYAGYATASGQVGDLVAQDASGASHTARARLKKALPLVIKPGENVSWLEVSMDFQLLTAWS